MVELPDTAGLICGFCFSPEGVASRVEWESAEGNRNVAGPAWLHFSLADIRAHDWLNACEMIPPQWRELLVDTDSHVRIETSEKGFAGVLGDLRYDADSDLLGVMRLYVDERFIFTARLHPLKTLDQLRLEIREGLPVRTPMNILFRFLEDGADTLTALANKQGQIVNEIEDLVLADRFIRESEELGGIRRLLTRLRRHVEAQRHALSQLAHRPPRWFGESDILDLRRAIEQLNAVFLDLEAIQERARLLQDEIAGRIANATNRNLYVVSLLTAIFLPITLISGIFGMNVGGLPWVSQDTGFGWVIAVMLLTIMTSLALLHWRRFF